MTITYIMKSQPANNKSSLIVTVVLFLITLSCFIYLWHIHPRIAYVRSAALIYDYNGMRDARNTYKQQSDAWQANVDTLRFQYQRCLAEYQGNYKTLSESERSEKQAIIRKLEENLKNYTSVIREQAQEKEKGITEGVLNQINSYVEEYAKKKGYDFIIGGNNGNLLYGNKAYDITDEVLEALNKEYKIMPAQPAAGKELPSNK